MTALHFNKIDNSLDLLAPGAPALELIAHRPELPTVHYHSIIGEAFGSGADSSDGVVPYTSAHLDGVESEITVPANHLWVHHHPRAVLEVERILREHLRQFRRETGPVLVPASSETPDALSNVSGAVRPGIVRR